MVVIKRVIEPYERKNAQEKQLNTNPSGKKPDPSVNLTQGDRILDQIADFVGISRPTFQKIEDIVEAVEQEPEKYPKR